MYYYNPLYKGHVFKEPTHINVLLTSLLKGLEQLLHLQSSGL